MIYIPMKMNNNKINWHAMGLLYYYFLIDHSKYTKVLQKYNKVILEYKEIPLQTV